MTGAPHTVLLTGATGIVGGALREYLGGRYELRLLTRTPADFPSHVAPLEDLEAIKPAFQGVDAVIHLAAAAYVEAPWQEVLDANIVATRNVFEAARCAGVPLVVFASSSHVVGVYEMEGAPVLYELDDPRCLGADAEPRPDSLYGVSKVFGEALGRYHVDCHGMRVICVRIGSVLRDDDPRGPAVVAGSGWIPLTPEQRLARLRATWMSRRDCAELFASALEATHVRWAVVYGTSDNPRQLWDLGPARELLGFEPSDGAPA